jgi:hypothetical protein
MSVHIIDKDSRIDDIEDFYSMYIESFSDLCVWKGQQIIDLGDYLRPNVNLKTFIYDIDIVSRELGIIIYYTHNDDVITSIAFVEIEPLENCFVEVKFLCSNQSIKSASDEKSQATYLLDYIFNTYKDKVILIKPASPSLIPYYTRTRKPSFPYGPDSKELKETYGHLVFGRLTTLKESCFARIFRSIGTINKMVETLYFDSLSDLYDNTHDLKSLKYKLITKLDHLVKITKEISPIYYEQTLDKIINGINFYDIADIIMRKQNMQNNTIQNEYAKSGGKKSRARKHKTIQKKSNKSKKSKKSNKSKKSKKSNKSKK